MREMYNIPNDMKLSKNFSLSEFVCKDGSNEVIVNYELIGLLQKMRDKLAKSITITTNGGYRTPKHNAAVGGIMNSEHTKGTAADIKISGLSPLDLAYVADKIGFRGIGVYPTFTHVDIGPQKLYWKQNSAGIKTFIKSLNEAK
jgi:uncharacterized protein YcbK (DUF882 family)